MKSLRNCHSSLSQCKLYMYRRRLPQAGQWWRLPHEKNSSQGAALCEELDPTSGASTPYKRWSKCTMKKIGGKVFAGTQPTQGGKCVNYSCTSPVTRCQILRLKCTKFDFGWGSAPDPTGGANSAPPDSLAATSKVIFGGELISLPSMQITRYAASLMPPN